MAGTVEFIMFLNLGPLPTQAVVVQLLCFEGWVRDEVAGNLVCSVFELESKKRRDVEEEEGGGGG